jgi:hypothetical protein
MKSSKPVDPSKVFLLRAEDTLTAFSAEADARGALADGDALFGSPDDLKRITADWPSTRLVQLWNSIPGVVPVKKFMDRPTALKRLWAAIQVLEPLPPSADKPLSNRGSGEARPGTKKAKLLSLLERSEGASVRELVAALGWQSHSVRGCLSTLARNGAAIHSFRRPDGERAYSTKRATESNPEGAQ